MSLPASLEDALQTLPEALRAPAKMRCVEILGLRENADLPDTLIAELPRLLACSPFAARLLRRYPQWLGQLCPAGEPALVPVDDYAHRAQQAVVECNTQAELKQALRELRQRETLRLAWRDLAGLDDLDSTLQGLSALADALVDAALGWLLTRHAERHGQAVDGKGEAMGLVVLGMGKLGGRELNFSSDVDLIFAFAEAGQTNGPRPLSHEEYFRGLAQQLVQVLNEHTEHGFVFRVDTRLRPFGDSGPLVLNFAAMENYYQTHGREWERYAMIKARPVAGDIAAGEALLEGLRPFVYRRYLDYSVYDSLREMKAMIERETVRKGLQGNIKLGRGGIREIEFMAQVYQLIRGGQDPALQERSLRRILALLAERGLLPAEAVAELDAAYVFLRRLENRLQAYADRQTHELPAQPQQQAAMALAMDAADWDNLAAQVASVRETVYAHFHRIFGQSGEDEPSDEQDELRRLWRGVLDEPRAAELLQALGFAEPAEVIESLTQMRDSSRFRNQGESARRRVDDCVPMLIEAAAQTSSPGLVLQRMLTLLQALVGRTTYVALLVENPTAVPQLARLCAASSWIAEQLIQHPMLLDSLLDPRILYAPPRRLELEQDLRRQLQNSHADDLEWLMDCVRRFKQTSVLRVAAADVSEAVPLMVVSDHLTEIADVVLAEALRATQLQLQKRHGRPLLADGSEAGFAVIAYGKFGGIELGYGSDLDLVFVHGGESAGMTDGERSISHDVYFNRLGQRLIHFLTAFTPAGRAYEVDMRLRPNGESGLLVPSLSAFATYQRDKAWTWEHQALVRARWVAGDKRLGEQFSLLRQEILSRPREDDELRRAVVDMREKMRASLEQHEAGCFDLKQGRGGITDIEFMTQYFVLRYTRDFPQLARFTDNIRIMDTMAECGLWTVEDVTAVCNAYRHLRRQIHRQALQSGSAVTDPAPYAQDIECVRANWRQRMCKESE